MPLRPSSSGSTPVLLDNHVVQDYIHTKLQAALKAHDLRYEIFVFVEGQDWT